MDTQNRPPKPNRRMPPNSDWSNSESEKDDQARAPIPKKNLHKTHDQVPLLLHMQVKQSH